MKNPSLKELKQELQTRLSQQEVLSQLSQRILESPDLSVLLDETVHLAGSSMKVDYCVLLEYSPEESHLILRAGVGWKDGALERARIDAGIESQAGYTLLVNQPVIVEDLPSERRFSGSPLLHEHGVTSGMSVVIPGKEHPFGVLALYTRQPHTFAPEDANFLQSVANVLASAILRVHSESALRLSRDQLSIILEGAADGIIVQDAHNRLVFANQAAVRILGAETQEMLLNAPLDRILQEFDLQDESGNPFPLDQLPGRLALQGKSHLSTVIRFKTRQSDQYSWSLVKSRPVFDQDGRAVMAISVFHDVTRIKQEEKAQFFLAEAGKILSSSLDYAATLNSVAQLATDKLADWCLVDVVEEDQTVHRLAVAHSDPKQVNLAREFQERYPTDWDAPTGVPKVLRSGRAEFYPEISKSFLEEMAQDEQQLEALEAFGLRSAMIMPLIARGQTFGAMTLVWAELERRYTETDLILAEELARRAAVAIDNARLYREAQNINAELEARVTRRTEQLHSLITTLRNEIAERKKTEEELHRSETILSSLFESAPDGHVLVDADGIIMRVNAQAEVLFGYKREELLGKPVDILLPERLMTPHIRHRITYMAEQRRRPMGADLELFAKRKDGSEFAVDIMLSPVQTENENLVIAAIRDISERKQMEAELAEVQRRLIENVEAERLSLAQELHDGPIQDLYGITYNLNALDEELDGTLKESAGREALNASREMTQQVIDFLRSISGELRPPTLAPYGLEKAIRAHVETIRSANPELEIDLDLAPDGQMLPERVRLALYRIYQHAARNVIRHAQAKRLSVRLAIDAEQVQLGIEDDGCGFELPSHWVVLARGGHFGLVGTYERVKAIGGDLKIRTAPGQGTLIQVTLPRSQFEDER